MQKQNLGFFRSATEFFTVLGRWGWVLIVDILGGAVGAVQMVRSSYSPGWVLITVASAIILILASMLAFHKVRVERDSVYSVDRFRQLIRSGMTIIEEANDASTKQNLAVWISTMQAKIQTWENEALDSVIFLCKKDDIGVFSNPANISSDILVHWNQLRFPISRLYAKVKILDQFASANRLSH